MKAELKFDDGKVVKLSEETTNRLREELCKPVKEQLVVGRFRAIKNDDSDNLVHWVRIAIVRLSGDIWDGKYNGNAKVAHLLSPPEVRKIANGLLKMLGD